MTTISNEVEWATAFPTNGFSATGTYTITASFTFSSAPNKPNLQTGATLQGSGYVITIADGVTNYQGLVYLNGGTVINVQVDLGAGGISNAGAVSGGGIVCGYNSLAALNGGTVQNCYVRAPLNTTYPNTMTGVGGIVGGNYGAVAGALNIYRCYVAMTITGLDVGGIIGPNAQGAQPIIISNCYVRGSPGKTSFYEQGSDQPASGSALFVAAGSSGTIGIIQSYGYAADAGVTIPDGVGLQTEVGGFFAGIQAGNTMSVINSWMLGIFTPGIDNNGAIYVNDGFYTGTATCTGVLYDTAGSADGVDTTQPAGTEDLATYSGVGTNLPSGWSSVWLRNGSYPYLGGPLGFADAPWDPLDYTEAASLALLVEGACVVRGTLIRTPTADVPIESLCVGDKVVTGDGRISTIKRINHWSMNSQNGRHFPRRIPANYFGEGLPFVDLFIHQDHAFQIDGKWIHVNHHVPEFERMMDMKGCEYFHLQLDNYMEDTYIANGLTVETWDGRTPIEFTQANLKFKWSCDNFEERCLNDCQRERIVV